jgi:hypothetical protein
VERRRSEPQGPKTNSAVLEPAPPATEHSKRPRDGPGPGSLGAGVMDAILSSRGIDPYEVRGGVGRSTLHFTVVMVDERMDCVWI